MNDAYEILRTLSQANRALLEIPSANAAKLQEMLSQVLNETLDNYIPAQRSFTPTQRQVFNRHYYAGQSLREVATATGKTYDYVRSVNVSVKAKVGLEIDTLAKAFDDADFDDSRR